MIQNIPTEGLLDKSYKKIMEEMESLRNNQLDHSSELTKLGTNNLFYSIIDRMLCPFKSNHFLRLPALFLLTILKQYLVRRKKILYSYYNLVWNYSTIESVLSPFKTSWFLRIPVSLLLTILRQYFMPKGRKKEWYIRHVWDKDAILDSTKLAWVRHTEYPWAITNAYLDKPMKILDIGSGASVFPIYLASKGHEVYATDNDEILMNRVSPKLAEWSRTFVNYKVGDVIKINFDENTFDRVFCISVLEHLEEEDGVDGKRYNFHKKNLDITAINEMLRVVKPNGLVIITVDWSENPDDVRSYKLQDIYERLLKPYRSLLLEDRKPNINWDELKHKHNEAFHLFSKSNLFLEGWAMGIILQKKLE